MTIELAERVFQDHPDEIPPVIGEAAALLREVEEVFPGIDVRQDSGPEAAIVARHAFFEHTEEVRETLLERFPDDSHRVERLLGRAANIVDELLDDTLVTADSHLVDGFYKAVRNEAIWGNSYALRALKESAGDPDSTGAFRMPTLEEKHDVTVIDKYRYAIYDKQVLDEVRSNPLEIDLDEAEVILTAPVLELRAALTSSEREKATIVPLSAAVRLIIGRVSDLED